MIGSAIATARRLAFVAWLAHYGLAVVPRSELDALRRIADREQERLARGGPWDQDRRLLWRDLRRAGMPVQFQEAGPEDYCPRCGTAAEQRTCIACGLSVWLVDCEHMLQPPIAWGTACGDDATELYCIACATGWERYR